MFDFCHYLFSKIRRSKSHLDLEQNRKKKPKQNVPEEQNTKGDFHERELSPRTKDENEWEVRSADTYL